MPLCFIMVKQNLVLLSILSGKRDLSVPQCPQWSKKQNLVLLSILSGKRDLSVPQCPQWLKMRP